jgi:hypothetical protein
MMIVDSIDYQIKDRTGNTCNEVNFEHFFKLGRGTSSV